MNPGEQQARHEARFWIENNYLDLLLRTKATELSAEARAYIADRVRTLFPAPKRARRSAVVKRETPGGISEMEMRAAVDSGVSKALNEIFARAARARSTGRKNK